METTDASIASQALPYADEVVGPDGATVRSLDEEDPAPAPAAKRAKTDVPEDAAAAMAAGYLHPWVVQGVTKSEMLETLRRAANLAYVGDVVIRHERACAAETAAGEALRKATTEIRAQLLRVDSTTATRLATAVDIAKLLVTPNGRGVSDAYYTALAAYDQAKAERVEAARVKGSLSFNMGEHLPMGV